MYQKPALPKADPNFQFFICIYLSVIHCWNRCVWNMFYSCVIFIIVNKRKQLKKEGKKEENDRFCYFSDWLIFLLKI